MNIYNMILLGQLNFFLEMLVPLAILMRRQPKRSRFYLRYAAVLVATVPLYFMPMLTVGPFMLSFPVIFILILLVGVFCYRTAFSDILFYTVGAFAIQHLCWNVLFTVYSFIGNLTQPVAITLYLTIYAALYTLAFFTLPVGGEAGERGERGFVLAISALILVITYILGALVPVYDGWTIFYRVYAFICCLFALCIQFGVFERRRLRRKNIELERDKIILEELLNKERKQYEFSRETIEMINLKCHDLKHRLTAMRGMDREGRDRSIDELEQTVMIYGNIAKTCNETLDVVLTEKSLICEKYKIRFTYMVDGESLSFMDPVDLSSLFGNALDNAIESVVKEEDSEKRIVRLNVSVKRKFLSVHFENYCASEIRFEDGLPVTTKNDRDFHGFGVKSIRYIVEKYGGTLLMGQEGCLFHLNILFLLE